MTIFEACLCCEDQPAEDGSEHCDECELQGCIPDHQYCKGDPRPAEIVREANDD